MRSGRSASRAGGSLHLYNAPMDIWTATSEERDAVTAGAALHDRSSCARLVMAGDDRIKHLHRLSTNEVRERAYPAALTTVLTTHKGRIFDLLTVLFRQDDLLLLGSDGRGDADRAWLEKFVIREKVSIRDASAEIGCQALLGPRAEELLREAAGLDLAAVDDWVQVSSPEDLVALKAERYLGRPSVLLLGPPAALANARERLLGLGARPLAHPGYQAVRVASGIPAAPWELSEERNPWEARLDGSISLLKGCYIGQEVVARLDTYKKVHRALVRFELEGDVASAGERIAIVNAAEGGRSVGHVSSLARHPATGRLVGLGYLSGELLDEASVEVAGTRAAIAAVPPWAKAQGAE